MSIPKFALFASALLGLATLPVLAAPSAPADAPLTPQKPIVIPGGPGGFDWMLVDAGSDRVFVAGSNGKLAVIDMKTGKVTSTVDIKPGVDQIAYDRGNQRIYCACSGFISVVQATEDGAKLLGNITSPKGSHTIAVDQKTHAVWTCYFDAKDSYLMKLTP